MTGIGHFYENDIIMLFSRLIMCNIDERWAILTGDGVRSLCCSLRTDTVPCTGTDEGRDTLCTWITTCWCEHWIIRHLHPWHALVAFWWGRCNIQNIKAILDISLTSNLYKTGRSDKNSNIEKEQNTIQRQFSSLEWLISSSSCFKICLFYNWSQQRALHNLNSCRSLQSYVVCLDKLNSIKKCNSKYCQIL